MKGGLGNQPILAMDLEPKPTFLTRVKRIVLGGARNPFDQRVFHHLSLIAFFAWVGMGADGLSSSCYGPEEAFKALHEYRYLAIFVGLASAVTVLIISASYTQVIEQFPGGGGGYVVASKLLSPTLGMISGCALLMDYVLTITISIASAADAFFSFLPPFWQQYKLVFAILALSLLSLMNLRGVKETVIPLVPIFLVFVLTHAFVIGTTFVIKISQLPTVIDHTVADVKSAYTTLGLWPMMLLMLKAYSMGAGTYTGIEAVSNGMPLLREPRIETGKRTMRYMAISLAVTVLGLMFAYLLFDVKHEEGRTLNAVLFESFTRTWRHPWGWLFVFLTLLSEAALLFIAAQVGFLDGPRVLVNMALDRWFPHKFATFSDRLVTKNGVLLMAFAALITMALTGGAVGFLIVLYAINVFITFVLSQLGMVLHWGNELKRGKPWKKGMLINGTGLILCSFILVSVVFLKFKDGGWITILITGSLVVLVTTIRSHYENTKKLLRRLEGLVSTAQAEPTKPGAEIVAPECDANAKTAVLLVNGFNGLGLHTLLNVIRLFPGLFKNFVFVHVGVVDAGNFKGAEEMDNLDRHVREEGERYVKFVQKQGFYGEAFTAVGTDVVNEIAHLAPVILKKFPQAVFFGGQLVFPQETLFTRLLHNYTVFSLQRRFYSQGIPVVILPIRV